MKRLGIFNRFIEIGFIFLYFALIYNQIIQFRKYQQLSFANRIRVLPQSASRGRILDRNGDVLAGSALSYNLLIMPGDSKYPIEQISRLSSLLSIPEEELNSRYKKGYTAPFVPILLYKNIPQSQAVALGQLRYDLPGVIIQKNPSRTYPLGSITSHALGYLRQIDDWRLEQLKEYGYKIKDLIGYSGVEQVYDYILRPHEGGMHVEVDSKGRLSRILGFKAPQKGRDIQLTIDSRLQKIIHNNIIGRTGCIIVLDPDQGEILALVGFPDFDPEVFNTGSSSSRKSILSDPDSPLLNRATNGLYPPGSIFKVIIATAGLEKKKIDSQERFYCPGNKQIGRRKFKCWMVHEDEDIIDALAHSCNVFFYTLGLRLGPQLITEYALKFGLDQPTGIDLGSESKGNLSYSLWERIKRRQRWFAGDTANLSIGQGQTLVTPLQLARMMAAVANGGRLIRPRLLKSIEKEAEVIDSFGQVVDLGISEENLEIIRRGLIGAVSKPGGTAAILKDAGIPIAGKTGTAQVTSGEPHGWFVGYFPTEKPRFVICVFLEHIGSGYYCCELAKVIIQQMLAEGLI